MNISIINKKDELVDLWVAWSGVIPSVGDNILVRVGDYKEIPVMLTVIERRIDGTKPNKLILVVDWD